MHPTKLKLIVEIIWKEAALF